MSYPQSYAQDPDHEFSKPGRVDGERKEPEMPRTRADVAETFLRMLAGPNVSNAGYYVNLAYKYGVPIGRIIAITGFDSERVIGWIEEDN